jgi:hypothetical protein
MLQARLLRAGKDKDGIPLLPYSKEVLAGLPAALAPLFRSSASFHPLISSLLALLSAHPNYRSLFFSRPAAPPAPATPHPALPHLLAMCSSAPEPVCLDACVAIAALGSGDSRLALELLAPPLLAAERLSDVFRSPATPATSRLFALVALRVIAVASTDAAAAMSVPTLLSFPLRATTLKPIILPFHGTISLWLSNSVYHGAAAPSPDPSWS